MHAKKFYLDTYNGRVVVPNTSQKNTKFAKLFTTSFPCWPLDSNWIVSSRHY